MITDEMTSEVAVIGLACGVEYTLVAGGTTLNGDLVGPRRFIAYISTPNTCQHFELDYDVRDDDEDNDGDGGSGSGDDNEG